jgi:hypothetical protein
MATINASIDGEDSFELEDTELTRSKADILKEIE